MGFREPHRLPDGTLIDPWDSYEERLAKWKEQQKYNDKKIERELQDERIRIEHEFQKRRSEQEISNRYFIALATLSAASITLLIQFIFNSADEFGLWQRHALKFSLMFFGATLISCVLHNFLNSKEEFIESKKDALIVTLLSFGSVFTYIAGVGTLILVVMNTF